MGESIKFEARKNFFSNELNMERMEAVLNYVIENLTLKEILKMIRTISYAMVCYYDKDNCGIIYKGQQYNEEQRWQACQLQRLLSASCDLFGQSIIDKHEFDNGYLNKWLNGGAMEIEIAKLKEKIERLKEEISYEEN